MPHDHTERMLSFSHPGPHRNERQTVQIIEEDQVHAFLNVSPQQRPSTLYSMNTTNNTRITQHLHEAALALPANEWVSLEPLTDSFENSWTLNVRHEHEPTAPDADLRTLSISSTMCSHMIFTRIFLLVCRRDARQPLQPIARLVPAQ